MALTFTFGFAFISSACSPEEVGRLAVSQDSGVLLVALVRCDDTPVRDVSAYRYVPQPGSDTPKRLLIGEWHADSVEGGDVVLDTATPSSEWRVERPFSGVNDELDRHFVIAWARGGARFGGVGFTRPELESLDDGEWLYYDDPAHENATTDDLDLLRKEECDG